MLRTGLLMFALSDCSVPRSRCVSQTSRSIKATVGPPFPRSLPTSRCRGGHMPWCPARMDPGGHRRGAGSPRQPHVLRSGGGCSQSGSAVPVAGQLGNSQRAAPCQPRVGTLPWIVVSNLMKLHLTAKMKAVQLNYF